MKKLLLISISCVLAVTALAATNPAPPAATVLPDKVAAAQSSSDSRSFALSLLKKRAEMQAKIRSFICVEEISTERQSRSNQQYFARFNGNSRIMMRSEYRTDGNRFSIRSRFWGNIKSAAEFLPEDRCPSNRELWDGKTLFSYAGTTHTPATGTARYGTLSIETRMNEAQARQKMRLPWLWSLFQFSGFPPVDLAKASSLSVRTNLEPLGQAKCFVIDVVTPMSDYTVTPPIQFTVYGTLWIDPERGHNIVQATRLDKYAQGSVRWSASGSLERVVCKEIEGIWMPVEGYRHGNHTYTNGYYEKLVDQLKIGGMTLNPDHTALRSFVPDDFKTGALVQINPVLHQPFDPKQLPLWQDGRVVDKQGKVLFDSGLKAVTTGSTGQPGSM